MSQRVDIEVTVNGAAQRDSVEPRTLLSDYLRHGLGLTGTHVGCEHGVCGACTVLVDGQAARSCLLFAVQADGCAVTTVEGLSGQPGQPGRPVQSDGPTTGADADRDLHPLQAAFRQAHALQCGFCTPGFLMTLIPFLADNPEPSDEDIRVALSGNLCRCTGYIKIIEAVKLASSTAASAGPDRDGE